MGSSEFFGVATIGYVVAMIVYVVYMVFRKENIGVAATTVAVFSFLSHTAAFVLRWVESYRQGIGHAPLTNLYESLIFFVWCLMLGYLIIEFKYKNRHFGAFVTPIAGMALGFIELTGVAKGIQPLVPALQSNWLLAHVTLSFISYAAFALSFAIALMYLIVETKEYKEPAYIFWTLAGGAFFIIVAAMGIDYVYAAVSGQDAGKGLFRATFFNPSSGIAMGTRIAALAGLVLLWRYGHLFKRALGTMDLSSEFLDELTYKMIAAGFPVFTLGGLIFGAIWADQAWGVYWSWDPKETWSLITWLVYAFYLHCRFISGWRGKRAAVVAVLGFITVVFTYLGVNIFLSGLHAYGGVR